jgi:hypothetical protein
MNSGYLREKAQVLERLASSCFDADTAAKLRIVADEFHTVADRSDNADIPEPFMYRPRGPQTGGIDRH